MKMASTKCCLQFLELEQLDILLPYNDSKMYRRFPVHKIILPLLIIGSITVTYSDSAIQTDWSGGSGVWGPVTEFGTEFYFDSGIACFTASGDIALEMLDDVVPHNVAWEFEGAASVYSEDIDGDGDMDILGAAYGDDEITWWENIDGTGTSWTEHIIDDDFNNAVSIYSEDIDGDGDMDVLGSASWTDGISWWENAEGTGIAWVEHTVDFNYSKSVYSEDIDGDGDMDILGVSDGNNKIVWWENTDGTGTLWVKHIVCGDAVAPRSVYSEDIDGDGDMDVIANSGDSVNWWENVTGSGVLWAKHAVGSDFDDPECIYSADIDGDGDMDVLGAARSALYDDISWWENADGIGTSWVKHIVHNYYFLGASSVYSADMDNDGDMDILGAGFYEGEIDWFENLNGSGTSWGVHALGGYFGLPKSAYSEDINGDGIMDVIGAASGVQAEIAWWEVLSYPAEGPLVSSVLDVECSPVWDAIGWSASEPAESSVGFQVRSSADPDSGAMGPWSDTLHVPCSLEGILTDGEQYVQYMVILETSDPDITPILHEVMLSWNPLGIPGDTGPDSFELLPFYPNPSCSAPLVRFGLPEVSSVKLFIFDVSGRLVNTVPAEEYPPGYHSIVLDELSPGLYFCWIICGDIAMTRRLVVTE